MPTIIGKPDRRAVDASFPFAVGGRNWLLSTLGGWADSYKEGGAILTLDLSQLEFLTLFEWVSTVALIERAMADGSVKWVELNLLGKSKVKPLSPSQFLSQRKKQSGTSTDEFRQANRVYRIAGFIESLRTQGVLNLDQRASRTMYPWLNSTEARILSNFTRSEEETIVMPLCRIYTKEDCRQFLDHQRIANWREAMGGRFRDSPLFQYEEIWRVFCHELSVNIYEHAKSAGFLAGRVVSPYDGNLRPWCAGTYPPEITGIFELMKTGFLELCVCDAGVGFLESLGASFRESMELADDASIKHEDMLAFAFDEIGTSKKDGECWATSRHALGRILQIVAKYGGVLTLRSGHAEVIYVSRGEAFERIPGRRGYRPQHSRHLNDPIPGAHFQLILPLIPFHRSIEKRNSILVKSLPVGFHPDPKHVRGHLVPLLERLGTGHAAVDEGERAEFRRKCELLARELIQNRPATEALIIDFSNLRWTAAQFETLLYLLQNVLLNRVVLLVEISPDLAREVVDLERDMHATFLYDGLLGVSKSAQTHHFGELSEQRFLETYRSVHATVLGVDTNSCEYIFGLADRAAEQLLLGLIDHPRTFEEICFRQDVDKHALKAVFHNTNQLFQIDDNHRWYTVWNRQALVSETRRAMSRWFDDVATRCQAWWGRNPQNLSKMKFNLPWQNEWVSCFFEAGRILSRQRHADEAAQRLIFRLENGLERFGKSLSEVKVLACVTAPAIMLATALHRWWPKGERPAIADLGPYLLLHDDGLPTIAGAGGIVVVQDVLDRKRTSSRLVQRLIAQGKEVICILSLAQLVDADDPNHPIGTTDTDAWDTEPYRSHSMVNLKRPSECSPAAYSDRAAFWVEPRTLRPFNYDFLRRRQKSRLVPKQLERPEFFAPQQEGLLCAGHYVYGERHYTIALDVKAALDGAIGDDVSNWLSKVCMGTTREPSEWESLRSLDFRGDVTAVLMPLHSQIHYLWPKIEIRLAANDRHILMCLLDATLFLGHGPAYRLPLQLQAQIDKAMIEILTARRSGNAPVSQGMRLLIVDDAMVRARTAETILAEIDRAVRKSREKAYKEFGSEVEDVDPIEWIRYFAVFDQMGHARRQHWRNLTRVGFGRGIPFIFEEYKWISGVPDYEESNCPACAELERLQKLADAASHAQADAVRNWAEKRAEILRPIAIDTPGFQRPTHTKLPRPINLLPLNEKADDAAQLVVYNADEAILRFFELNYLSYPPNDILRTLRSPNAWGQINDTPAEISAYERFRWAVFAWCLQKWPRLVADSACKTFFKAASAEIKEASPLAEPLFEGMARHRHDAHTKEFLVLTLRRFAQLECLRRKRDGTDSQKNEKLRVLLADVVSIFLLSMPKEELRSFCIQADGCEITLIEFIRQLASSIPSHELSFLGGIYLRFTRPLRFADPAWSLHSIAETLLRGRNAENAVGSHRLLPRLLYEVVGCVATMETWRLLHVNLSSFLAAVDDLSHFSVEKALPIARVKLLGDTVLAWLSMNTFAEDAVPPKEFDSLLDELDRESDFCRQFDEIFHQRVESLRDTLEKRAREYSSQLQFEFRPEIDVKECRVLAELAALTEPLTNWAIDAARNKTTRHKSRIEVRKQKALVGKDSLRFRILTNFDTLAATNASVVHGRNFEGEIRKLKLYGAVLPPNWVAPSMPELFDEGFTAVYQFDMPAGFIPNIT